MNRPRVGWLGAGPLGVCRALRPGEADAAYVHAGADVGVGELVEADQAGLGEEPDLVVADDDVGGFGEELFSDRR
jgi:hypothetical protein